MVNKIIKINKIETNDGNNTTYITVELEHGAEQNNSVVIEFKGDNSKNSLEKFREEKWEKGGHLVKYNPDFLVDREKFKNEKELGWKYFPLEPILSQEKNSFEEVIYISALDYRVGMLCIPERKRLEWDIKNIEACENDKDKLSMRGYGNHSIYLDSSREFHTFFSNQSQIQNQGVIGYVCKCGFRYFIADCGNSATTGICPNCKSTISGSKLVVSPPTWEALAYTEVAYRILEGEKEVLKKELARETEQAEMKEKYQQSLLKKTETKLAQEKEKNKNLIQQLEVIQQEKQELLAKIEAMPK